MTTFRISEEEFARLGYRADGGVAVPISTSAPDAPDEDCAGPDPTWELERLLNYARAQFGQSETTEAMALSLAKKSAAYLFRAGHAFFLLRGKVKQTGKWLPWLRRQGLSHSTVTQAIQLYKKLKTETAVAGLTITEAKAKAGIILTPRRSSKTAGSRSQPRRGSSAGSRPSAGEWRTPPADGDEAPDETCGSSDGLGLFTPDGETREAPGNAAPLPDPDGGISAFLGWLLPTLEFHANKRQYTDPVHNLDQLDRCIVLMEGMHDDCHAACLAAGLSGVALTNAVPALGTSPG